MSKLNLISAAVLCLAGASAGAAESGIDYTVGRDISQQQRIEAGLRSGDLSMREASALLREVSEVDAMTARALKDGTMSEEERRAVRQAQDKLHQDIKAATSNTERGDPQSAETQRMVRDVQRNVAQDERLRQGIRNDSLSNSEVRALERAQQRTHREQQRAARDGELTPQEQERLRQRLNRQSGNLHEERHDAQERGASAPQSGQVPVVRP